MTLETARLTLRPCTLDDVDALHAQWTDPDVRRYLWDGIVIDRDTAVEVVHSSVGDWADHGAGLFVIQPRGASTIIGFCGFRRFPPDREWELLYALLPAYWGQGLAVEASQAALAFAFSTLAVDRIAGRTDPPNAASVRVLEKLGMSYAGRTTVDHLDTVCYWIYRK